MSCGDIESPTIIKIGTRKSQVHGFIMVYVTQYFKSAGGSTENFGVQVFVMSGL